MFTRAVQSHTKVSNQSLGLGTRWLSHMILILKLQTLEPIILLCKILQIKTNTLTMYSSIVNNLMTYSKSILNNERKKNYITRKYTYVYRNIV